MCFRHHYGLGIEHAREILHSVQTWNILASMQQVLMHRGALEFVQSDLSSLVMIPWMILQNSLTFCSEHPSLLKTSQPDF